MLDAKMDAPMIHQLIEQVPLHVEDYPSDEVMDRTDVEYIDDVWVVHAACRHGLAPKKLHGLVVGGEGTADHLERNALSRALAGAGPHHRHPAFPDNSIEAVLVPHDLTRAQSDLGSSLCLLFRYGHGARSFRYLANPELYARMLG